MADKRVCSWGVLSFTVSFLVAVSKGFNLDPRFSVIKNGPENSYFGYSVTEHQIVNEGKIIENLILVGAPKQQIRIGSTLSGGAIFKCNAVSTNESDCHQLNTEPFNLPVASSDDVTDRWLGVVLHSFGKGEKIVTCAHRHIKENAALGLCYTLEQTLDYHTVWIPCLGKSHVNFLEDFGLCQAGISAAFGQEDSLVIGAPGSNIWRGVMFMVNTSDSMDRILTTFNTPVPVSQNEVGASKALPPPTDKYSYLGYSAAIGKFDATRQLYYVSGAPRSNERGEVIFFRRIDHQEVLHYTTEQKLEGERDFAGFGSSLLALDLNNDGYDDLIVGAPYYYENGYGGAVYVYLGGKTMISKSTIPTVILSRKMSDAECIKLGCEHARFGISLAKLGDVNHDGYQDFAVGAPYEGNGTVYIYHGSKSGVVKSYAQRIAASDMPGSNQFQSFGSSLSGGLDLDSNGYPDLLVGSYESSRVVLLRARAIIHLLPEITVSPKMVNLSAVAHCSFDSTARHCVQLRICLKFKAEPSESFTTGPEIKYRVEAERSRSISRLEFKQSADASKKFVEDVVQLRPQALDQVACVVQLAYLKDVLTDKLNPMELAVTFSQSEPPYARPRSGDPLPNINTYPVLSTTGAMEAEPNTVSTLVDFVKECGDDNLCKSNLQFDVKLAQPKEGEKYLIQVGDRVSTSLNISITNLGEAAYLTRVFIQKPPLMDYQGVGGDGQDSVVKCNPNPGGVDDDTLIICDDIGNPLKQQSSVMFSVRLSTHRLQATDKILNITVWVNTSSTEQTPENDQKVFMFNVILEAKLVLSSNVRPDDQILCAGEPRGASAMKSEKDIGAAVNHTYIVSNRGNNNVTKSRLTIMWPYEAGSGDSGQGKYLLYLMEKPIIEKGKATCVLENADTVNPLQIKAVEPQAAPVTVDRVQPLDGAPAGRKKRATESESRVKRSQGSLVELGCKQNTARCHVISCELENLEEKVGYVQITLRARLWESTLLQDYKRAGDVKISSYAKLEIDSALGIKEDKSDNEAEAVTYAVPDFKDSGAQQVMWWVILLAVLGGIIVLAIIIFILYKIGFFRRKRPEEMQMYQAEKKEQKMLVENDDDDEK
ncbi:hypothetical protein C0Q70_09730 [Pomacea canaliculata]|uniref:Uncharacterized protein n=1 Tax=Pomacea canaliculata TaxID=400727 RepID=A0A2T7PAL1_POMCA|nr:integrin alpha-PS1-like [Pomacea canaliculata]PVD30464.1 hypothetical protein C0Q70_09730 [Pomacea canaliculata]